MTERLSDFFHLLKMGLNSNPWILFEINFLSISLFLGAWIVRDSNKYLVPKFLVLVSLILTYFTGPIGLTFYWFLRIFFSKKINFND